jgi:hypothetical protein
MVEKQGSSRGHKCKRHGGTQRVTKKGFENLPVARVGGYQ